MTSNGKDNKKVISQIPFRPPSSKTSKPPTANIGETEGPKWRNGGIDYNWTCRFVTDT